MFKLLAKIERQQRQLEKWFPPEEQPAPPPPPPLTNDNSGDNGEGARKSESILDFMVRISPRLHRADHFQVYARHIEQGVGGGIRLVFAAPPQHGKTEVTLHGLTKILQDHGTKRHAYITYSLGRAKSACKKVRSYLARAGVVHRGTSTAIYLPDGGQCIFTSIDAGLTGEPVDGVAIIDDYYKNRAEADSSRRREVVRDAYREVIETRCHPGASIFVLATRWHPEDLSATLIAEGWQYINLPALAENDNDPNGREVGEALFPVMWPADALEKKRARVGDFAWWSLFQGHPRPKGGKIFHEPTFYSALPTKYRGAYGVDLAFSAKTSADHSICLELWREDRDDKEPLYYVVHVDRAQVEAPEFTLTLKSRHVNRSTWPMWWRCSGTEMGAASFIRKQSIPIKTKRPPGDKLVSATDAAAAWNDGRILVPDTEHFPEAEKWLHAFLGIVANFTGSGKEHDDDVDALGNAHAALGREVDSGGGDLLIPSTR